MGINPIKKDKRFRIVAENIHSGYKGQTWRVYQGDVNVGSYGWKVDYTGVHDAYTDGTGWAEGPEYTKERNDESRYYDGNGKTIYPPKPIRSNDCFRESEKGWHAANIAVSTKKAKEYMAKAVEWLYKRLTEE